MASKPDYYETLGVPRSATTEDVKKAYRRLARTHHPDVNRHDEEAEDRFKAINEAYQVLSDNQKRAMYDRFGHAGLSPGGAGATDFGFGFGDIFDAFFGGGGFGAGVQERAVSQRGADLRVDVELTLEEVATGVEKSVRVSRMQSCDACKGSGSEGGNSPSECPTCRGSGQVRRQTSGFFGASISISPCQRCRGQGHIITSPCRECGGEGRFRGTAQLSVSIPAGVDDDNRIRLSGEGDAGVRGGAPGNIYVFPHIRNHPIFERRGNDIWLEARVTLAQAALGATIEVPTLDGKEKLHLPEGAQAGEVYRLRERGLPGLQGRGKGSLNVALRVETPARLSEEERKLLEKFAEMRGEKIEAEPDKSFFEKVKDAFGGR